MKTLQVLGPRILVKVKKFKKVDQTFEGSSILMPETQQHQATVNQCTGEVVQLGSTAYSEGDPWVKPGDFIHFTRYGAIRLHLIEDDPDFEYWVLMAKDPLVIEQIPEKTELKENQGVSNDRI